MEQRPHAHAAALSGPGDNELAGVEEQASLTIAGDDLDFVDQDPNPDFMPIESVAGLWANLTRELNDRLDQAVDLGRNWFPYGMIGQIGDNRYGVNDVDLVRFDLNAGERLFIETDARDGPGLAEFLEVVLRVFDSSGTELAFDFQSYGSRLGSFISFEAPADGSYIVGVSGAGNVDYDPTVQGSGRGGSFADSYRLKVSFADISEPSDTLDQADDITDRLREAGSVRLRGFLGDGANRLDDVDLALFELEAGEILLFEADLDSNSKFSPFGATLRAFDSSGTELAVNDYDVGSFYSLLSLKAPADGVYAVGVSSYPNDVYDPAVEGSGSDSGGPGIYDLLVRFGDVGEPGDTIEQADDFTEALREAGSLSLTGIIGDTLSGPDDVDLVLLSLDAGEVVYLDARPGGLWRSEIDPLVRVFDSAGNELATDQGRHSNGPALRFEAPDAGTYAVGLSGGDNADYDPNVEGSGSGLYQNGAYRLNVVTNANELEVGLYDADSDQLITLIEDGSRIGLDGAESRNLTIVATVPGDSPLFGFVESVRFDLNDGAVTRTESFGAFSLFGDTNGDFQGGDIPLGENSIGVDLYSENRLQGDFLGSISRSFTIVDFTSALEIGLYDADTDALLALIGEGDEIQVDGAAERNLTIAATVPDDSPVFGDVESARLDLNSGAVTQVENFGAFSLFGDPGGDLQGGDIPLGENVITFDLFSENRLQGDFLGSISRNFTIVDPDAATTSAAPPFVDDLV